MKLPFQGSQKLVLSYHHQTHHHHHHHHHHHNSGSSGGSNSNATSTGTSVFPSNSSNMSNNSGSSSFANANSSNCCTSNAASSSNTGGLGNSTSISGKQQQLTVRQILSHFQIEIENPNAAASANSSSNSSAMLLSSSSQFQLQQQFNHRHHFSSQYYGHSNGPPSHLSASSSFMSVSTGGAGGSILNLSYSGATPVNSGTNAASSASGISNALSGAGGGVSGSSSNVIMTNSSTTHLMNISKSLVREIVDADLQKELLLLEEQEGSINFKFGIVYAKYGQLIDDEMFSNGILLVFRFFFFFFFSSSKYSEPFFCRVIFEKFAFNTEFQNYLKFLLLFNTSADI